MPYHTIAQIQAQLNVQQIEISESSQPDEATVTGWIVETDAKIEAALKDRYELPPTNPQALAILAEIAAKFTAARVWRTVFMGQVEAGAHTYADVLDRQAQDVLNALAAGDIEFPDEDPLIDPTIGPGSPDAGDGFDRDPIFTMETIL